MVTLSIRIEMVADLHARCEKIIECRIGIFGSYIQRRTGPDMLMWQDSYIVHDEFKSIELKLMDTQYPDVKVLVHLESPESVI